MTFLIYVYFLITCYIVNKLKYEFSLIPLINIKVKHMKYIYNLWYNNEQAAAHMVGNSWLLRNNYS